MWCNDRSRFVNVLWSVCNAHPKKYVVCYFMKWRLCCDVHKAVSDYPLQARDNQVGKGAQARGRRSKKNSRNLNMNIHSSSNHKKSMWLCLVYLWLLTFIYQQTLLPCLMATLKDTFLGHLSKWWSPFCLGLLREDHYLKWAIRADGRIKHKGEICFHCNCISYAFMVLKNVNGKKCGFQLRLIWCIFYIQQHIKM